jgi:hypothetical protein
MSPRPIPAAPMIQRRVFSPTDIGDEGDDMDESSRSGKRSERLRWGAHRKARANSSELDNNLKVLSIELIGGPLAISLTSLAPLLWAACQKLKQRA